MRITETLGLATGAVLMPFTVVTGFLLASRNLPGTFVFPLWIGVLVLGVVIGVACLFRLTANGWRRFVLSLVYIPVILSTTVVYSFYFTGAILGESAS